MIMFSLKNDRAYKLAVLHLTQLRAEGQEIRSDGGLVDDSNIGQWLKRVEIWSNQTSTAIQEIDHGDAEYFKTLDTVPPPRVFKNSHCQATANQSDYLSFCSQHDLRLRRLDELLTKYVNSL